MYDFALYHHLAIKRIAEPCESCLDRLLFKLHKEYLPSRLREKGRREIKEGESKEDKEKREKKIERRLCGYGFIDKSRSWDFVFDCPVIKPYLKRPPQEKQVDKYKFVYKRQAKLSITMKLALDALGALAHKRYSIDTRDRIIAIKDCLLGIDNPFASERGYFWGERDISYVGTSIALEQLEGIARISRSYARPVNTKPENEEVKPSEGEEVSKPRTTESGDFLYYPPVSNVIEAPHFTFAKRGMDKFRAYGEWRQELVREHYGRVIKGLGEEIVYLEEHPEEDGEEYIKGLELGKGVIERFVKMKEFERGFEERNHLVYNRRGIVGVFRKDELRGLRRKKLSTEQKKRFVNNTYKLFLKLMREILGVKRDNGKAVAYLKTNFYNPILRGLEVSRGINNLKDPQKKGVLESYYYEGKKQTEIAREMGIDQATVSRIIADFKLHKSGSLVSKPLYRGKRG